MRSSRRQPIPHQLDFSGHEVAPPTTNWPDVIRRAWHEEWRRTQHGSPPKPFVERAMGRITALCRSADPSELPTWEIAARAAARAGSWHVDGYWPTVVSRGTSKTEETLALADAIEATYPPGWNPWDTLSRP